MYFFGAGQAANKAYEYLKREKNGCSRLVGIIDTYKSGHWKEYKICKIEEVGVQDTIVITCKAPDLIIQIAQMLLDKNYENVFYFDYTYPYNGERYDFLNQSCKRISILDKVLIPHLETHVSDVCNLNCRGCTHFSPLFKESRVDHSKSIKGLMELKNRVDRIFRLYIMGGEPLLYNSLDKYLDDVATVLSDTEIWLVTNGILILQLNQNVFETIRKNKVVVSITVYSPMVKKIPEIVDILEKNKISYDLRESSMPRNFCIPLTLSENSIHPHLCLSEGCINIRDDMISRCPTAMYIWKFNDMFNLNLPNDGVKKINEFKDGEELLGFLNEDISLCRYCIENEVVWSQCGKDVKITDFAIYD